MTAELLLESRVHFGLWSESNSLLDLSCSALLSMREALTGHCVVTQTWERWKYITDFWWLWSSKDVSPLTARLFFFSSFEGSILSYMSRNKSYFKAHLLHREQHTTNVFEILRKCTFTHPDTHWQNIYCTQYPTLQYHINLRTTTTYIFCLLSCFHFCADPRKAHAYKVFFRDKRDVQ